MHLFNCPNVLGEPSLPAIMFGLLSWKFNSGLWTVFLMTGFLVGRWLCGKIWQRCRQWQWYDSTYTFCTNQSVLSRRCSCSCCVVTHTCI